MIRIHDAVLSLAILGLASGSAHAAESYDNCTGFVDALPATITTPGTWCLRKHLSTAMTSGTALSIQSNNVVLDCNDFRIGGLAAGPGTLAWGIAANNRRNITVRNCGVRGFIIGLWLQADEATSGGGHFVEKNRFDANTYVGIRAEGDGTTLRDNQVHDTGGSTVLPTEAYAIQTRFNVDVIDNTIQDVHIGSGVTVAGIWSHSNANGSISRNRVRGLMATSGDAFGIMLANAGRITVRDNTLHGPGLSGIYCSAASSAALNNVAIGFNSGLSNCNNLFLNFVSDTP